MKKVFSNSEVVHVWANRQQTEGRNTTNSIFFYRDTIYSYGYHFAIAKILDDDKMLFTTRGYSNTTRKHISIVSRASSQYEKIYCPIPDSTPEGNFNYWLRTINDVHSKLSRAKKPEKYLIQLEQILYSVKKYCDVMQTTIPDNITQLCGFKTPKEVDAYIKAAKREAAKKLEEANKRKEKAHRRELAKFRRGENFMQDLIFRENDYLRLVGDNNDTIETTQKVKIDVDLAKLFHKRLINKDYEDLTIKGFPFKSIDKKHLVIGCHKIEIKEVNKILTKLSLECL